MARGLADLDIERIHHDPDVGELGPEPLEHLQAAGAGHLVVEHDHVRQELLAGLHALDRIARHPHALHVRLGIDEIAQVLPDRRMVVDGQYANVFSPHSRSLLKPGLSIAD